MGWPRLTMSLALRALRSPAIGVALLRVAWRFRRRGWWRRSPFLPLPRRDYVRWRMYTAYGDVRRRAAGGGRGPLRALGGARAVIAAAA